ncbi:MAG: hypothetical protein V7749_15810 [Cocleimonas sp.]
MNHNLEALPDYFLKLSFKFRQFKIVLALILMTLLVTIVFAPKASAKELQRTAPDAQKLWNKTCFTCHGDSADIARNFLTVVDGKLQGPMHKDTFRTFLTNHYLSKIKADAIYSMLLTQANTKTRFEQECSSCHQKAAEFVYKTLFLRNGILYSKKLETPTYDFLETHRDLNKKDVKFFMKKLTLIGYEIYVPLKN